MFICLFTLNIAAEFKTTSRRPIELKFGIPEHGSSVNSMIIQYKLIIFYKYFV